ncbi:MULTISPECIES: PDR/VanB family oxidoreductase [unclassified Pseudonocardia]|uniref:PDR/VanB family oxidoreductase n=1 Tax=unclassified Pseudonocardia TaxID=2619320 RepID=UPI001CF6EDB4|nr:MULTISPECIES: PDR/VanB family oxidoreductase [unclassified Pseudonocardia]
MEVAEREPVADGVVRLTLRRPDSAPLPVWEPGAHLDLHLGADLVRQYSLCGDPADRTAFQVAVLREQDGRGGSAHVHDVLEKGTVLTVQGPRNNFALAGSDEYLFVAGGIGITPILPMVAAAERAGARWRLVYGGRARGSMAFVDGLVDRYGDRVDVVPQDERGLLDLDGLLGVPRDGVLVYCCGPEPLLAAVEQRCSAWPPGALHLERFSPKEVAEPGTGATTFEVEFAGSGVTVEVPPGVSIVDAAAEAGVEIETSCREGVCGTCESAVLEGVPDHRDSVLTPDEQAANDVMFPCVSRCLSGRLVLDR